jgi:hypothetical protein
MGLDMTGDAKYNSAVHYRQYLGQDGKVVSICVQNFDYHHYTASRFLSSTAFRSEEAADAAQIDLVEMVRSADLVTDDDAVVLLRNIRAVITAGRG